MCLWSINALSDRHAKRRPALSLTDVRRSSLPRPPPGILMFNCFHHVGPFALIDEEVSYPPGLESELLVFHRNDRFLLIQTASHKSEKMYCFLGKDKTIALGLVPSLVDFLLPLVIYVVYLVASRWFPFPSRKLATITAWFSTVSVIDADVTSVRGDRNADGFIIGPDTLHTSMRERSSCENLHTTRLRTEHLR